MKKLSIVLVLALVLALAAPALAADVDINGELEIENRYNDTDSTSKTDAALELYLEANPAEKVTLYSELDYEYDFDTTANETSVNGDVGEAWIKVEDVFGPVTLKAGRMEEVAADSILYDVTDEGVEVSYAEGNFSGLFSHSIDSGGKVVFAESKLADLDVVDAVTLNYIDSNVEDYDGYTIKVDKKHDFVDASVLLGDANEASVMDLKLASTELFPGVTTSLEYATVEEGFTAISDKQDSIFNDTSLAGMGSGDIDMIKPGVAFDVTDNVSAYASYAMYGSDNLGDHDYIDLGAVYTLAEGTNLEVEYEDNDYDYFTDSTTITTTLTSTF